MLILNIYSYHLQEQLNFRALTLGKLHTPPVVTHLSPTMPVISCAASLTAALLFSKISHNIILNEAPVWCHQGTWNLQAYHNFIFLRSRDQA